MMAFTCHDCCHPLICKDALETLKKQLDDDDESYKTQVNYEMCERITNYDFHDSLEREENQEVIRQYKEVVYLCYWCTRKAHIHRIESLQHEVQELKATQELLLQEVQEHTAKQELLQEEVQELKVQRLQVFLRQEEEGIGSQESRSPPRKKPNASEQSKVKEAKDGSLPLCWEQDGRGG